jgi:hypothetical protein
MSDTELTFMDTNFVFELMHRNNLMSNRDNFAWNPETIPPLLFFDTEATHWVQRSI